MGMKIYCEILFGEFEITIVDLQDAAQINELLNQEKCFMETLNVLGLAV